MPAVPSDYLPEAKTKFYRWDENGAVIANGRMERGHVIDEQEVGGRIREGSLDEAEYYVNTQTFQPILRPVIEPPAKRKLAPRETVTLIAVPAATVYVRGTVTANLEHKGGDLKLGFALPGNYTVILNPWPAKTLSFTVEVAL